MIFIIDVVEYEENDLYHFLNSSLAGRMILGKYKYTKKLDENRLVDMVIFNALKDDPINYT